MKNTSRKKSDSSEEDEENCESTSRFNFLRTVELIFICVSLGFLIWTYFTVPKAFRIYENSTSEGIHIKFKMFLHDEKENPNVAPKAGYDDDSVDNLSIAERIGIDRWKLNIPESTTSKSATTPEVINEESRFFPFYIYILLICNCTTIIIIVVVDLISHAFDEPINKIPVSIYWSHFPEMLCALLCHYATYLFSYFRCLCIL